VTSAAARATLSEAIPRASRSTGAVVLFGLALVLLPVLASMPSSQSLAVAILVAALPALWLARERPSSWLLILSLLAWASRPTVSVAGMNMHVEQPVIAISAVVFTWQSRSSIWRLLRLIWPALVGLAIWLGAAATSSLVMAPEPVPSLRIVAWLGISIVGAWVALLVAERFPAALRFGSAFVIAGLAQVMIAIWALASGGLLGIGWGGWSFSQGTGVFRAFALAWEPNIYASAVALTVPFAIHRYRFSGARRDLAIVGLLCFGIGLGLTRATWVALAMGAVAYWVLVRLGERRSGLLVNHLAMVLPVLVLATAGGTFVGLQARSLEPPLLAVSRGATTVTIQLPPLAGSTSGPVAPPAASATPSASEAPGLGGPGNREPVAPRPPVDLGSDTNLAFRLIRVQQAIQDLAGSPWLGLGANSFGQRHGDPTQAFLPDYLGVFPLTVLYDAGLIGFAGFLLFALWTIRTIWRSARPERAAYLASFAVMITAYAATDAFRFAQNWLIIGAGVGIAVAIKERGHSL
jgi:hypothetical protein